MPDADRYSLVRSQVRVFGRVHFVRRSVYGGPWTVYLRPSLASFVREGDELLIHEGNERILGGNLPIIIEMEQQTDFNGLHDDRGPFMRPLPSERIYVEGALLYHKEFGYHVIHSPEVLHYGKPSVGLHGLSPL